ncbi:hypothetical protein QZH41_016925 [Actinostola sp. cb2023]|nr:hypothetical protein QZH41_016925 [Actinostola sp. cb2023]
MESTPDEKLLLSQKRKRTLDNQGVIRRSRLSNFVSGSFEENSATHMNTHAHSEPDECHRTMEMKANIQKFLMFLESDCEGITAVHRPVTALNSPLNTNTVVIKSESGENPGKRNHPVVTQESMSPTKVLRPIIQKPSMPPQQRTPTNKPSETAVMFGGVSSRECDGNVSNSIVSSTPQPKLRIVTSTHAQSSSTPTLNGSLNARPEIKWCSLQELLKAVEPIHFHSTENIQDAAMRLMTSSIRFARNLPCFTRIPFRDQIILLEESWKKLFLLDAAYWALPLEIASLLNVATGSSDPVGRHNAAEIRIVQELLTHLRSFRCDLTELACLKGIIIFRPEAKGLKDAEMVDKIQDDIQLLLSIHVSSLHPNHPTRFGKLLLSLLPVQSLAEKPIEEVLFKVTSDKDIFETLLSKLIDS